MRKIVANYVFPVTSEPLKNGVIELDENGIILNVRKLSKDETGIEFYDGIIVPGFVNAHCHLELSQFKGKIQQGRGLPYFIKSIVSEYNKGVDFNLEAIEKADAEMMREGIVAVGDISAFEVTKDIKRKSAVYYHTFLEGADFFSEKIADEKIAQLKSRKHLFEHPSFYAHAPYSCSVPFIKRIAQLTDKIFAIHNQEDKSENEF